MRLLAVVTPAEVRGVTATAVLAPGLDPERGGLVVRGASRSLPAGHIGELLGLPVWARLPYDPAAASENGLQADVNFDDAPGGCATAVLAGSRAGWRGRPAPPARNTAA